MPMPRITSAENVKARAYYERPDMQNGEEDNPTGYEGIPFTQLPDQVQEMLGEDFPAFAKLFLTRSLEYGDAAFDLGPRGQFSDMYRKMIKLKIGMWEGREEQLTSETVDEILLDLIGHCFLSLQMRRKAGIELVLR
jgi:hypothetical protein